MKKRGVKGQAALEFLMTYGWAILVVLIAIGALAYFGVLNPKKFAPESCTIAPGFSCDDFKVNSTHATFIMRNGRGETLYNLSVTLDGCTGQDANADNNATTGDDTWVDGEVLGGADGITLSGCSFTSGDRIKKDLTVSYKTPAGLTKTIKGQVIAVVE